MRIKGVDIDVYGDVSVAELKKIRGQEASAGKDTVGFARRGQKNEIYVATDGNHNRRGTFFHEALHHVLWGNKIKLAESTVVAIEEGIVEAYESINHKLPDPSEKRKWRFRD